MLRRPAVAGQFYPSDPRALKKLIASFGIKPAQQKISAIACVLPHAGYIYSGKVAAEVLSKIEIGDTCIILGPNHTGYGVPVSIAAEGEWLTPLGQVAIDSEVARSLLKNSRVLQEDALAHAHEHCIEVELPLLQASAQKGFLFVPIVLAIEDKLVYKDIAHAIAKTVKESGKKITLVASSDMTHYETQKSANAKDEAALQAILKMEPKELLETVSRHQISMCGAMAVAVVLEAAKELGAKKATLVSYQTSGDVTGDYSSVVGYAGVVIE